MIDGLSAVSGRPVSRETFDRVQRYVGLLTAAAATQNLIAPSTIDSLWERHILDSAQLARFQPTEHASWLDIGSGAGLPGLVIALLVDGPVTLVEPRRLRVEFLRAAVSELSLTNRVTVEQAKVERITGRFDVITARAVAGLDALLGVSHHLSTNETVWVLPRGRNAQTELAQSQRNWHCDVGVEQSCTDPESAILVLTRVGAKKKR